MVCDDMFYRTLEFLMWKNLSTLFSKRTKASHLDISSPITTNSTSRLGAAIHSPMSMQDEDTLLEQEFAEELSRSNQRRDLLQQSFAELLPPSSSSPKQKRSIKKKKKIEKKKMRQDQDGSTSIHLDDNDIEQDEHPDEEEDTNKEEIAEAKRAEIEFDDEDDEEWLKKVFATSIRYPDAGNSTAEGGEATALGGTRRIPPPTTTFTAFWKPDDLQITLAEEAAELYILGQTHWEYSKMMDYIAEFLTK